VPYYLAIFKNKFKCLKKYEKGIFFSFTNKICWKKEKDDYTGKRGVWSSFSSLFVIVEFKSLQSQKEKETSKKGMDSATGMSYFKKSGSAEKVGYDTETRFSVRNSKSII